MLPKQPKVSLILLSYSGTDDTKPFSSIYSDLTLLLLITNKQTILFLNFNFFYQLISLFVLQRMTIMLRVQLLLN
jgi:hypothetical protein